MATDYWQLTKDYKQGDAVQKIDVIRGDLSPFVGRVTAVHNGLGVIDVQWPFGNQREFPDELVLINPALMRYLPPSLDQSYSSYDITKAREASTSPWLGNKLPATFYKELSKDWYKGASEVLAYDNLYRLFSGSDDEMLRSEVAKFYRVAGTLMDLRVQQFHQKTSAYWFSQNRTYRATADEVRANKPGCPKCGSQMRRTTYRMERGARVKLFACPKDLYLLDPASILGPSGEPHSWF